MTGLAEFLLARIAEDEAAVRRNWNRDGVTDQHWWGTPFQPSRVLAKCAADRRIVEEVHHRAGDGLRAEHLSEWQKDACEGCGWGGPCDDYWVEHLNDCPTLRLLALPYADHADYREEWKP